MDKKIFFDNIRGSLYGGSIPASAVTALDAIIDEAAQSGASAAEAAYMMATAFGEAGSKLVPVRENLNYTKAETIRAVWPSRFKTLASAVPYVRQPQKLANKVYGGRLGNDNVNDGWLYRGGGLAQTTGEDNFKKVKKYSGVDVVANPSLITRLDVSIIALVHCMIDGVYTGKKLSDFDLPAKFFEARAIINADKDRVENGVKIGNKFAGYANKFFTALTRAGYGLPEKQPAISVPVKKPEAEELAPKESIKAPVTTTAILVIAGAGYAAWDWLINAPCNILSIFCGN